MQIMFSTLLFIWWCSSCVYGIAMFASVFDKTVSPNKGLLDIFILDTIYAQSIAQCARQCAFQECGNFMFMDGDHVDSQCYNAGSHTNYMGIWNISYSGTSCQRWDSQFPHNHSNSDSTRFPDATLEDAANYCRDPDGEGILWCYTTDPDNRYETCDMHKCMGTSANCRLLRRHLVPSEKDYESFSYFKKNEHVDSPCYNESSHKDYRGTWSMTYSGFPCQRWDSQTPHGHTRNDVTLFPDTTLGDAGNHCRDPDDEGSLWCYTTDPKYRFQTCGIVKCTL